MQEQNNRWHKMYTADSGDCYHQYKTRKIEVIIDNTPTEISFSGANIPHDENGDIIITHGVRSGDLLIRSVSMLILPCTELYPIYVAALSKSLRREKQEREMNKTIVCSDVYHQVHFRPIDVVFMGKYVTIQFRGIGIPHDEHGNILYDEKHRFIMTIRDELGAHVRRTSLRYNMYVKALSESLSKEFFQTVD